MKSPVTLQLYDLCRNDSNPNNKVEKFEKVTRDCRKNLDFRIKISASYTWVLFHLLL